MDKERLARGDLGQYSETVLAQARAGLAKIDNAIGKPGCAHTFEGAAHGHHRDVDSFVAKPSLGGHRQVGRHNCAGEVGDAGAPVIVA